jgi:hypothetical protein
MDIYTMIKICSNKPKQKRHDDIILVVPSFPSVESSKSRFLYLIKNSPVIQLIDR